MAGTVGPARQSAGSRNFLFLPVYKAEKSIALPQLQESVYREYMCRNLLFKSCFTYLAQSRPR